MDVKNRSRQARFLTLAAALMALALTSGPAAALQCHVGTIKFYTEGGIKSCQIEANHTFTTNAGASLTCLNGGVVAQHPGGQIESCTTAAVYQVGDARCEAGHRVELKADGSIVRCER